MILAPILCQAMCYLGSFSLQETIFFLLTLPLPSILLETKEGLGSQEGN